MSQKALVSECQRVFKVKSHKHEINRTAAHKDPKDNEQRRKEARRRQRQAKRKGR